MWISNLALETNIFSWWNIEVESTAMFKVAQKLKNVKRNIKVWKNRTLATFFRIRMRRLISPIYLKKRFNKLDITTKIGWRKGLFSLTSTTSSLGKNIFGNKDQELIGLKKGTRTPSSSIYPPLNIVLIIGSLASRKIRLCYSRMMRLWLKLCSFSLPFLPRIPHSQCLIKRKIYLLFPLWCKPTTTLC